MEFDGLPRYLYILEETKTGFSLYAPDLPGGVATGETGAGKLSTRTANNRLKTIKIAFQQAWRDSLIAGDPAAKVPILKTDPAESSRRGFTRPTSGRHHPAEMGRHRFRLQHDLARNAKNAAEADHSHRSAPQAVAAIGCLSRNTGRTALPEGLWLGDEFR